MLQLCSWLAHLDVDQAESSAQPPRRSVIRLREYTLGSQFDRTKEMVPDSRGTSCPVNSIGHALGSYFLSCGLESVFY